jgi:hypothetical protein
VSVVDNKGEITTKAEQILQTISDDRLNFDKQFDTEEIRLRFELKKAKPYSFTFVN